jgi:hypothetical protein
MANLILPNILTDMLKALIRAEADVSNILEIVGADKRAGEQFHATPIVASSLPSVAECTIKSYTPGCGGMTPCDKADGNLLCFGCGKPHHWAKKMHGKWVILCPHKDQPGVMDRAKLAIAQLQSRRKKKIRENTKH